MDFTKTENVEELIKNSGRNERRFRVELYVDVFVPNTLNLEEDMAKAKQIAEEISSKLPNSYVGEIFDPSLSAQLGKGKE